MATRYYEIAEALSLSVYTANGLVEGDFAAGVVKVTDSAVIDCLDTHAVPFGLAHRTVAKNYGPKADAVRQAEAEAHAEAAERDAAETPDSPPEENSQ